MTLINALLLVLFVLVSGILVSYFMDGIDEAGSESWLVSAAIWLTFAIAIMTNIRLRSHGPAARTFALIFLVVSISSVSTMYIFRNIRSLSRVALGISLLLLIIVGSRTAVIRAAKNVWVKLKDGTEVRLRQITKAHQQKIVSLSFNVNSRS